MYDSIHFIHLLYNYLLITQSHLKQERKTTDKKKQQHFRYQNKCKILSIFLPLGFLSSTKLRLIIKRHIDNLYTLSCSTCDTVDGRSVEFLVNDKSEDSVRYVDNKCYHRNKMCLENRCSCSSNEFNWTFDANNKPEIHNFTCKAEFQDFERNCRKTQMITLVAGEHGK